MIITTTPDALVPLLAALAELPAGIDKATVRALNATAKSLRAEMVRRMTTHYSIKAKDVRALLKINKASSSKLESSVVGTGSPGAPLINFVRGNKTKASTKRLKSGAYRPAIGVPVVVTKAKGKVPAKGVFVQVMASGHAGAFKLADGKARTGKSKIKEAYGPGPIGILSGGKYYKILSDFADVTLQKNLVRQANYLLGNL